MTIRRKISGALAMLVAFAILCFAVTIVAQRTMLRRSLKAIVAEQAATEEGRIVNLLYESCLAHEARNQRQVTHSLDVARAVLRSKGQITLGEPVVWQAVNQFTRETKSLTLPKVVLGGVELGKNVATNTASPVVDEVTRNTEQFCTIFQRMNEEGDMLRVCTSVLQTNGTRALGTFIPRRNPDGATNPVVAAVLRGETFRGRAFVVNQWHAAAYEPIFDAQKRVVGMLYVGMGMEAINKEIHDNIVNTVVGKSGHALVIGGKGIEAGKLIVSETGARDGVSMLAERDADGQSIFQQIITNALQLNSGAVATTRFRWKENTNTTARTQLASYTYLAPWDWIIVAVADESDFQTAATEVETALSRMLKWTVGVAGGLALVGLLIAWLVSTGIARQVQRTIRSLTETSEHIFTAADHLRASSHTLTDGAQQQTESLNRTTVSMEQVQSSSLANADRVQQARVLTREARTKALEGTQDIQQISTAMDEIKVANTEISQIIRTIDDIAFQTNILALNASVEAARAGEAGAGFGVVANEVRNLAQRCAQAARETSEKIEACAAKTHRGVEIGKRAPVILSEIVARSQRVDELTQQIAQASNERTAALNAVGEAVTQLHSISERNTSLASESAEAADELNQFAGRLNAAVHELQKLVDDQSEEVCPADNTEVIRTPSRSSYVSKGAVLSAN